MRFLNLVFSFLVINSLTPTTAQANKIESVIKTLLSE